MQIKIGTQTDYVAASIMDTDIPNIPKIISLKANGAIGQAQKLELLEKIGHHCQENPSQYLLIANQTQAAGFADSIGQDWKVDNTMDFYAIKTDSFKPQHQDIPEKLESTESSIFLEYIASIGTAPEFLKSFQARCQHFSSTIYARVINGQIVSAAEIHDNQRNGFSIDMLGTIQNAKNQGHGTQLYSYLVGQVLEQSGEHIGNTSSDNYAMQRLFQKLGGLLQDSQITWSWIGK